jgi:SSS family solute:Na+ symporter
MAASQDFKSVYPLEIGGTTINAYAGLFALALNLVIAVVLTVALRGRGAPPPAAPAGSTTP